MISDLFFFSSASFKTYVCSGRNNQMLTPGSNKLSHFFLHFNELLSLKAYNCHPQSKR